MKFIHFLAFVLSMAFTACSRKPPADQHNLLESLHQRVKELAAENNALKHRLAAQESKGLTNSQIIHEQLRDMRVAAWLRDGRSTDAITLLEHDLPDFVKFYRTSGSFTEGDIWILHEIRDHYQKYHLPISAEMSTALPTPYPPCDAPVVSATP